MLINFWLCLSSKNPRQWSETVLSSTCLMSKLQVSRRPPKQRIAWNSWKLKYCKFYLLPWLVTYWTPDFHRYNFECFQIWNMIWPPVLGYCGYLPSKNLCASVVSKRREATQGNLLVSLTAMCYKDVEVSDVPLCLTAKCLLSSPPPQKKKRLSILPSQT